MIGEVQTANKPFFLAVTLGRPLAAKELLSPRLGFEDSVLVRNIRAISGFT